MTRQIQSPRSLATTAIALATAGLLCLPTPPADAANPVSRDIRDTSSRTTSTSGKVLVQVPINATNGLQRATRDYQGRPVNCHDHAGDVETKLILLPLAANQRYAVGQRICEQLQRPSGGLQTVFGQARQNASAQHAQDHHLPETRNPMMDIDHRSTVTVIAAGPVRRADLPADMQSDPWALLEANRFRDATDAFAENPSEQPIDRAGAAIAAAMTGSLNDAADQLAQLMADPASARALASNDARAKLTPKLQQQLNALTDTLLQDRPDAQAALQALTQTQTANGA